MTCRISESNFRAKESNASPASDENPISGLGRKDRGLDFKSQLCKNERMNRIPGFRPEVKTGFPFRRRKRSSNSRRGETDEIGGYSEQENTILGKQQTKMRMLRRTKSGDGKIQFSITEDSGGSSKRILRRVLSIPKKRYPGFRSSSLSPRNAERESKNARKTPKTK